MRRIVWRHRWLLACLTIIPVVLIVPLLMHKPITYGATSSIQAQVTAPDADTQVTAILSRVSAVATSPSVVQDAIHAANVDRNPITVARHDVGIASLGSSAVVTVTVTDPDPQVAVRLGRALAHVVVNDLNGLGTAPAKQLAALSSQRDQLISNRSSLLKELSAAQSGPGNSPRVQTLLIELNTVEAQISANESAEQQLLANSSLNQGAVVISTQPYAISQSRHVAVYGALLGVLGLVIGLLIATIHELVRPTIADPGAAARELSLVVLGNAAATSADSVEVDNDLPTRLDLAAHRLEARTLVLTGPLPRQRLTMLAQRLNETMPALPPLANGSGPARPDSRVPGVTALAAHFPPDSDTPTGPIATIIPHMLPPDSAWSGLRVTALPAISLGARPEDPALVLVLPWYAPRAALDQAVDLGVTTGWPLLGVISLRQQRRRRRRRWRDRREAKRLAAEAEEAGEWLEADQARLAGSEGKAKAKGGPA